MIAAVHKKYRAMHELHRAIRTVAKLKVKKDNMQMF
jgi:hypothetical protein